MGCDYYIFKILQVFYNDNDYLEIELHLCTIKSPILGRFNYAKATLPCAY